MRNVFGKLVRLAAGLDLPIRIKKVKIKPKYRSKRTYNGYFETFFVHPTSFFWKWSQWMQNVPNYIPNIFKNSCRLFA